MWNTSSIKQPFRAALAVSIIVKAVSILFPERRRPLRSPMNYSSSKSVSQIITRPLEEENIRSLMVTSVASQTPLFRRRSAPPASGGDQSGAASVTSDSELDR